MNDVSLPAAHTQREVLLHALYEAAELEHNLMCTYLYAAASLKDGEREGLGEVGQPAVVVVDLAIRLLTDVEHADRGSNFHSEGSL